MRIFLDTNILLDVFLRRPERPGSLAVLDLCVTPGNEGWMAWHSLSNGFCIVRNSTKSAGEAKRFAFELLQWINVATTGTSEAIAGEQKGLADLEDAMQIAAAEACQARVIITRNVGDFTSSAIPVYTPEDFLARYQP